MPVGNSTYISGESSDAELDDLEEINDDLPPGSMSASRVARLARLVAVLLQGSARTTDSSSAEEAISALRLQPLAGWLKDAEDVLLIVS